MYIPSRATIDSLKRRYEVGTRVRLISMGDDPRPLPVGTEGTVVHVDDMGTVHVAWDNGRRLGMCVLDGDVIGKA